jgi:hypothetical protein
MSIITILIIIILVLLAICLARRLVCESGHSHQIGAGATWRDPRGSGEARPV